MITRLIMPLPGRVMSITPGAGPAGPRL